MTARILLLIFGIVCVPLFAHAQVVITEIMYDLAEGSDSGREWIEVFNAGSAPVTVTDLKVVENAKNHAITAVAQGAALAPGAYAVIADNAAKFKGDYPSYAGQLFDSAFSLNNTGESVGISNSAGAAIDSVAYTNARPVRGEASNGASANGTGDSLQRAPSSAQFAAGIPTPGAGIPAGGLQKSPRGGESSKKTAADFPPQEIPKIVGEKESAPPAEVLVAAAAASHSNFLWWLAPLLLAVVGSLGAVSARHYRKGEWDIVEAQE